MTSPTTHDPGPDRELNGSVDLAKKLSHANHVASAPDKLRIFCEDSPIDYLNLAVLNTTLVDQKNSPLEVIVNVNRFSRNRALWHLLRLPGMTKLSIQSSYFASIETKKEHPWVELLGMPYGRFDLTSLDSYRGLTDRFLSTFSHYTSKLYLDRRAQLALERNPSLLSLINDRQNWLCVLGSELPLNLEFRNQISPALSGMGIGEQLSIVASCDIYLGAPSDEAFVALSAQKPTILIPDLDADSNVEWKDQLTRLLEPAMSPNLKSSRR